MARFRQVLVVIVFLAIVASIIAVLAASALVALAIFAPMLGVGYLINKFRLAGILWQSHGRFQLSDGIRIINANRARALAAFELLEGVGGLALAVVPTLFTFGPRTMMVPA